MASVVGGNLETLSSLNSSLKKQADEAMTLKTSIQSAVDSAVWTGANADKFRAAWDEFKGVFDKLQDELTQAATDVAHQHNNLALAVGEAVQI